MTQTALATLLDVLRHDWRTVGIMLFGIFVVVACDLTSRRGNWEDPEQ